MSGCTRRQRFWHVEVPTAMPQILVGVNQTTMAVLSVVIIAAIIGGFADIGWEVLSSMRKAEFGQSLLSGAVIALMAMVIDRITIGFARNKAAHRSASGWLRGRNFALSLARRACWSPCAAPFRHRRRNPAAGIEPDQCRGAQPWRAGSGRPLRRSCRDLQERDPLLLHAAAAHRHVRRGDALFLGLRSDPRRHRRLCRHHPRHRRAAGLSLRLAAGAWR